MDLIYCFSERYRDRVEGKAITMLFFEHFYAFFSSFTSFFRERIFSSFFTLKDANVNTKQQK